MRDYILNEVKEGGPIHYVGEDGSEKIRVGSYKGHWHGPAHVLTGGISGFHPRKGLPYTIRERARLQGFPDDFAFYGTVLDNEDGQRRWNHDRNMHMVRQTGKAMPIQFCTYVAKQVKAHIDGAPFSGTNTRVIAPNSYVDEAKRWYCQNVGYSAQEKACQACWLARGCDIRERLDIPLVQDQARLEGPGGASRSVTRLETPSLLSKIKHLGSDSKEPVVLKGNKAKAKVQEVTRKRVAHRPIYKPVPTTMMTFGDKK
jgi:uncharacterized protein YodC (DUF2158 family)